MTADPEAVTRVLAEHRPVIETPTFAGGRITGCTCGCSSDAAEYRAHLASVLASLPDDRLAEAEAPAGDGLVEQIARIVHNSRSTIPMCGPESSGPCWPIARALVAGRPWQAEVEAKALEDAAEKSRHRDAFAADGVDIFLLQLADDIRKEHGLRPYRRSARGEMRQP